MHAEAKAFAAKSLGKVPGLESMVEFGSRMVNGVFRDVIPREVMYIGIDRVLGRGVQIVADAADYTPPFRPNAVVCLEVLEHAENAEAVVANAYRILAPGGAFIATMATDPRAPHSAVDGSELHEGEFYRNVSVTEMHGWLRDAGFVGPYDIEVDERRGDMYVLAWRDD